MAFCIILLMILVSANLNQTLHKLVVQPMAIPAHCRCVGPARVQDSIACQESMLSVVKDNASQLLKQFGLEDDMDRAHRQLCVVGGE